MATMNAEEVIENWSDIETEPESHSNEFDSLELDEEDSNDEDSSTEDNSDEDNSDENEILLGQGERGRGRVVGGGGGGR